MFKIVYSSMHFEYVKNINVKFAGGGGGKKSQDSVMVFRKYNLAQDYLSFEKWKYHEISANGPIP